MKSLPRQPQSPRLLPDSSSSLKVKVSLKVIALENLSAEKRNNNFISNNRSTQNDDQPVFAILSLSSDQNNSNNNNNMIRVPSLPIDPSSYSTFHFTGQKKGFDIQWPSDRGLASAETFRYLSPSSAQQTSTASTSTSHDETEYETEYLCTKLNLVRGNEMLDLGHAYFGIAGKEEHKDIFLTLPIKDEEQLHNDTTSRNERTLHAVPPNMVPTTSYDEKDMNNKLSYSSPPVRAKEYPGQNYFPKDPSVGIHTSDDVTTLRIQISITKDLTQQQQQQEQAPLELQVQPPEEEQLSPSAPSTRRKFSPKNYLMSKSSLKRKKRQHENTRSETVSVSSKTESKESEVPLKEEKKVSFADFISLEEEERDEEGDDSCIALSSSVEYPLEDFKKRTSDEKFESCEDTSSLSDEERDDSEVEERRVVFVNEPEALPVNCESISSASSDQDRRTPAPVVEEEEEKEKKVTFVDVRSFTSSEPSRNISSEEEHKYESEDDGCTIPLTGSVEYSLEEFKRITEELKKSSKSSDGRFRFRRAKSFSSKMSYLKKSTGQKFQNFFTKEYEKETYVPCASIEDCEDGTIATSTGIYIIDSYGHHMVMLSSC